MKQILLLNILCLMSLCLSAQTYQTKRDISYSSKTDAYAKERLKLDVYYPEGQLNARISEFQFHHRCYGADIYDCEQ